jgi:hypothetical protein
MIKEHIEDIEKYQPLSLGPLKPFCGITRIDVLSGRTNGKQWLDNHRWMIYENWLGNSWFYRGTSIYHSEKNRLIHEYRKKCDICWLLITIDRSKSDQKFEFTNEMYSHIYHSCFDKIFFMDVTNNYLIELKAEPIM